MLKTLATFGCYAILGAPRTHSSSSVVGQKAGPCSRPRRFAFRLVFSLITKARREATRARNKPKQKAATSSKLCVLFIYF